MAQIRRKIKTVGYSTDYDATDPSSATWLDADPNDLYAENASMFGTDAEYTDLLDGRQKLIDADGSATYPHAIDDTDNTWLGNVEQLLRDSEFVVFREVYTSGHSLVIGPVSGVTGGVNVVDGPFLMQGVQVSAGGAAPGDTYAVENPS